MAIEYKKPKPNEFNDGSLFDKRLIKRNIKKGLITEENVQEIIEGLPDSTDNAAFLDTEIMMDEIQSH